MNAAADSSDPVTVGSHQIADWNTEKQPRKICPHCKGSGVLAVEEVKRCSHCGSNKVKAGKCTVCWRAV